jgi:hypothetical protein
LVLGGDDGGDLPTVLKVLPKLTALLPYATLSSRVGSNLGITSGTIFAAWKAAFALTRAAGLANVQAARSSRAAAGRAAAVAEATKVIKDRSCMISLSYVSRGEEF